MDAAQIAAMIADRKAGTPGLLDTLGRRNRKIVDRPCQVCGAVFRPDRASRKCCSRKCGTANNGGHNRMPERWVTHISGYIVGTVFINGVQTRVRQHRWIMQQHLGRELSDDEDVHHINGIKNDNRIENLEVISHSDHSPDHAFRQRTEDRAMRRHAEKKGGEIMTTDMEATIIAQAAELERLRAERDALKEACDYYEIGVCAVGVPDERERIVLRNCVTQARDLRAKIGGLIIGGAA